jgi:hypothetical protein
MDEQSASNSIPKHHKRNVYDEPSTPTESSSAAISVCDGVAGEINCTTQECHDRRQGPTYEVNHPLENTATGKSHISLIDNLLISSVKDGIVPPLEPTVQGSSSDSKLPPLFT